MTAALQMHIFL